MKNCKDCRHPIEHHATWCIHRDLSGKSQTTGSIEFEVGGKYNWKNQKERLVYLGHNFSGNGFWHQFALIENPTKVWCEVIEESLQYFEESND